MDPMQQQIDAFNAVDWHAFPGPTGEYVLYVPSEVPRALRALTEATTEEQAKAAYNRFLWAIGYNC